MVDICDFNGSRGNEMIDNQKIYDILADGLCIDVERVKLEAELVKDLGADSLDMVDLTMNLEEEFGLDSIDLDGAMEWITVKDVVDYVIKQQGD